MNVAKGGSGLDVDRRALELLVVDNDDLERLELLLSEFNIFEALGAVRQELRHSELLAFLLDPNESHGLDDTFLRRFLQRSLSNAGGGHEISSVDLDIWQLDEVEVRREWANIDILLVDDRNQFAILIENKIDSTEHSNQLQRYWEAAHQEFPDHKIVGLYLTPGREQPSNSRYIPIDYDLVANLVGRFLEARSSTTGADVQTLLRHYEQMLRRHIVSDSDIADLCRRIYKKHRHALDLIYEHRPDPSHGAARDLLEKAVTAATELIAEDSSRSYLRFLPKQWDVEKLRQGSGWTKSQRMLLFELIFTNDRVFLKLVIGPGPAAIRESLFNAAQKHHDLFKVSAKTLSPKYHQIFQRAFVDGKTLSSEDPEAIEAAIGEHWREFMSEDLPAILDALGDLTALIP
ncbi:MAG: PD-(D/E)XK nuclease family protein [Myxococcaceae bacterium]|nr:PD-(D/E)XK nuclease family protein [Myxococcaceae bacterium]